MFNTNRQNIFEIQLARRASGVFLSALYDADANKGKAFINSIESGKYLNEHAQERNQNLLQYLAEILQRPKEK